MKNKYKDESSLINSTIEFIVEWLPTLICMIITVCICLAVVYMVMCCIGIFLIILPFAFIRPNDG